MSLFFKKRKQENGTANHFAQKKKKRNFEKVKRDEEITSSEDELGPNGDVSPEQSSDDERESAQAKRLRLAKIYLEEIEKEERRRLETDEVSKEVLSRRLRDDHLKQIGKYEVKYADRCTNYDESNVKTLKCREQRGSITCICLTSDDEWLFSGSKDGVVIKWSVKDAKKMGCIPFTKQPNPAKIAGHSGCIFSLAVSTDKKFLVVGDTSGEIQVWNPTTLEHINTLKGHKKPVMGLCFQKDSHTLYSCSQDHSVRVWALDDMTFVETLFGHQNTVTDIDVLHSDKPVTAGGLDGSLRLWKVSEESQLIFNAHPGHVDSVKLINEQNFVSGGDDGQVSIWSTLKKKPLCSVSAAHGCDPLSLQPYWISSVTALPNSDLVASGSCDGHVRLWKLGERRRTIQEMFQVPITGFINGLAFTSDASYLIAGCGKDHKFGRWASVKASKNCIVIVPLVQNQS